MQFKTTAIHAGLLPNPDYESVTVRVDPRNADLDTVLVIVPCAP